jgi:hypothetical protein
MRREQWFPPHFDPGTFGSFTSFRRPGLDQLSFEFSKTAQHRKHQPSGWRCGVRPRVCQGFEQATTVSNLLHDGQQVDCRPPKPVQPCHDDHGPRLQRSAEGEFRNQGRRSGMWRLLQVDRLEPIGLRGALPVTLFSAEAAHARERRARPCCLGDPTPHHLKQ